MGKRKILNFERRIYAHTLFTHMIFVLPVLIPYYNHIGLTFRDFLVGEALFAATVFLFEIPSGWISDVWKRRTTLVCGSFIALVGYSTLMFANGFWMACLAQCIIGVAVALNSGTNTAILYDHLEDAGRVSEYRRIDGTRHAMGLYAVAFAAIIGSMAFTIHPRLPLMLDLLALLSAMIVIATVDEPKRHTKSVEKNMIHDMVQTIKYAVHGHAEVAGIILLTAIMFSTTKLMFWAQQAYLFSVGLPIAWYGSVLAGSYILGGILGQLSHKIEHWGSHRGAILAMVQILIVACSVLALGTDVIVAIPLFFLGTLAYGAGQPRINSAINDLVGAERRATILSTNSQAVQLLFIPSSLIVAQVEHAYGIHVAMAYMACQLAVLACVAVFLLKRQRPQNEISTITGT